MSANRSMNVSSLDVTEFENLLSLDSAPIQSMTATRWERKQLQQQSAAPNQSADRYIPHRGGMSNMMENYENMTNHSKDEGVTTEHAKLLLMNTLESETKASRVLSFKNKAPLAAEGYQASLKVLYSASGEMSSKSKGIADFVLAYNFIRDVRSQTFGFLLNATETIKTTRHIPTAPIRILDAPDMLDDYYLNLLSWSGSNTLAVALAQTVYLWNAGTGDIQVSQPTHHALFSLHKQLTFSRCLRS